MRSRRYTEGKTMCSKHLIYNSGDKSKCPRIRRILATLFLILCLSLPSIITALIVNSVFFQNAPLDEFTIALVMVVWFAFILAIIDGSPSIMYPHFKIYDDSVTAPLYHTMHPFSSCADLVEGRNTKRRGQSLIKFEEIECFIDTVEDNSVRVYLKRCDGRKSSPSLIFYRFSISYRIRDSKDRDKLVETLKDHGVREMPPKCPSCGDKTYDMEYCPNCKTKRI